MTLPIGTSALVVNPAGSSLVLHDIVTVQDAPYDGYGSTYVERDSDGVRQWVQPGGLLDLDLSKITDLEEYRQAVARVLFVHKALNGWCSSAEYLARQNGLAAYLPTIHEVEHTVVTTMAVWPGEDGERMLHSHFVNTVAAGNYYRRASSIGEAMSEGDEQDGPESEDIPAFQARLAKTALYGAYEYSVSGVEDFLLACGIDPAAHAEPREVSVSVSLTVSVPYGEDASSIVRDLLADVPNASVSSVWED